MSFSTRFAGKREWNQSTRKYIARFKTGEAEFSSVDPTPKTYAWRFKAYGKYQQGHAESHEHAIRQAEFLLRYTYGTAKEYEIVKLAEVAP